MNTLTQGLLICGTLAEAQDAARACQDWMLAHVPAYTAQLWDQPKLRPSDGACAIYIDTRVLAALTPAQLARLAAPNPADDWQPMPE
jgi:hypothetical protein